ncbi:hypothetical protein J437_LFUL002182 [Ladona fulva]|uniref:tRNA (guanine(37)-N1)-methyltransferase n=1 Tax=Ladona fulva TaxID=123851 RepID=A0A8K0JV62_LADFU|nr:hypothetical protein J437_LFUL002182 [Ladona fulva]
MFSRFRICYLLLKSSFTTLQEAEIVPYYRKECISNSRILFMPAINMVEENLLVPPKEVRGMKVFDRSLFSKTVIIPWLAIPVNLMVKCLKRYFLKLENLKPMQDLTEADEEILKEITMPSDNEEKRLFKKVYLNPAIVENYGDIDANDRAVLEKLGVTSKNFNRGTVALTYDNWRADELIKAVLPVEKGNLTSYSKIGHIVHVNLKEHLLDYKAIIGKILLDKVSGARTVVNKVDAIDNTYRNFQMELLAGEYDMKAQVRENRCVFEFDFSAVYWNPRLCTEHERILAFLSPSDVLFDVFAGVGPFSIPAARHRKCSMVYANDLNPESYRWLVRNASLNKVTSNNFKAFNKDGWKFIEEDVARALQERWEDTGKVVDGDDRSSKMHVAMNLPGRATEFLGAFSGLLSEKKDLKHIADSDPLTIHVYCFVPDENSHVEAVSMVESNIGAKLESKDVAFVRKVSPTKEMLRVTFKLPTEVLFSNVRKELPEPPPKRICLDNTGEEPGCYHLLNVKNTLVDILIGKMGKQKTKQQKMKQQLKQMKSNKIPGVFKVAGARSLKARAKAKAVAGELKKLNETVRSQVAEVDEQLSLLQEQLFQSSDNNKVDDKLSEENSQESEKLTKVPPKVLKESETTETMDKLDDMQLS